MLYTTVLRLTEGNWLAHKVPLSLRWESTFTCLVDIKRSFLISMENRKTNNAQYFVYKFFRAVFKWLSKVITWLRLLRLVIGLKESRQLLNQWEAKPQPIAPRTHDFSRDSSELQVIARNCDWFMALFVRVVIGRCNCFGFGFSTVIWKPLYPSFYRTLSRDKNYINVSWQ